jgi:hypothetical protein
MGSLVFKDFATCWKQLGMMLLMYLFFSLFGNIPADTYLIMGIFLFAMQSAYLEEKNNTLMLLKTLPLDIRVVVWSKYLSTFCAGLLFCAVGILDMVVLRPKGIGIVTGMITGQLIMLNVMGVFHMVFFRKGYSAASQISMVLFVLIFLVGMLPRFSPEMTRILQPVLGILQQFPLNNGTRILLGAILLGTYYLTSLGAIHFFRRRENY